jgi:hypothetical protein
MMTYPRVFEMTLCLKTETKLLVMPGPAISCIVLKNKYLAHRGAPSVGTEGISQSALAPALLEYPKALKLRI